MVQMIQLTRGQEETLARITTALEQIAENTRLIVANTTEIAENTQALTTGEADPSPLSPDYQHNSFDPDDDQDCDLPF